MFFLQEMYRKGSISKIASEQLTEVAKKNSSGNIIIRNRSHIAQDIYQRTAVSMS
jgi:hypothetical protein